MARESTPHPVGLQDLIPFYRVCSHFLFWDVIN